MEKDKSEWRKKEARIRRRWKEESKNDESSDKILLSLHLQYNDN